jgi:DNA-binding NarL/FixJ family response regulator
MGLLRPPKPRSPRIPVSRDAEYKEKTLGLREREALLGACRGLSNKEIATAMFTTEQTIKNQMSAVYAKLRVPNRSAAIAYVFRNGWLE